MEKFIKYNSTKIILTILFLNAIFIACKKKESSPAETTGTTTTTGLSPSTGGDYCNLQTTYRFTNMGGVVTKDSMVFASFYAAPVSAVPPTNVSAGSVNLNGINIPFSGASYNITSNVPTSIAGTLNWNVTGSGTVTAFSQSLIASYPKYSGGNVLPDTIVKTNGVSINITGITNSLNSVLISLYGGSANATKYILGSNGTVTFSPAELSAFPVNTSITLLITANNIYSANLGGIKRGFTNGFQYTKFCFLK
jgi:hypothetical protein